MVGRSGALVAQQEGQKDHEASAHQIVGDMDGEEEPVGPRPVLTRHRFRFAAPAVMQRHRLQRGEDDARAQHGQGCDHDQRLLPAERGGDHREQRRQQHLADVAGEIVGAERGA
jgi:hypothetical protein